MDDVFGNALSDYYSGKKNAEIEVRINGELDEPIPAAHFFRSLNEMPQMERMAIDGAKGRILDVGAAAGCHSLELQKKGENVTALEISVGCVELMKKRGLENVICGDIRDFRPEEKFDTILLLMNGLGIGGDMDGTLELLIHLKSILREDGQILADSSDLIYLYTHEDGSVSLPLDKYYGEVEFDVCYLENKACFNWVYLDPNALETVAKKAGLNFEVIDFGDHFDYLVKLKHV